MRQAASFQTAEVTVADIHYTLLKLILVWVSTKDHHVSLLLTRAIQQQKYW